jgi:hypothetical protein
LTGPVPDPTAFDDRDERNTYYELAIQLTPGADTAAALRAAWEHPDLEGCYLDGFAAPGDQERLAPGDLTLPAAQSTYGWAGTPAGPMACVTHVVTAPGGEAGDRVDVCLPVGALERLVPTIRHPIDGYEQNRVWREPLDVWFTTVADRVARAVPIVVAYVGEDVSGLDLPLGPAGDPPAERGVSVLVPARHGPGVARFAPTRWFTPW